MDKSFTPIDLTDEYRIGIDSVDQEHRYLIGIYNDLVARIRGDGAEDLIDGVIKKLFDYADYHFASEERVMVSTGFPGLEPHRRQHESFVRALNDLVAGQAGDGTQTLHKVMLFVGSWIRGHILVTDKQLGEYVHSQHEALRPSAG
ncbi:MAG: bacteriohemerythrin [Rhodospirillaceae bacterium]